MLYEVGYLDEDLHYVMDWDILILSQKLIESLLKYIPTYMGCLREYPEAKSFSGEDGESGVADMLLASAPYAATSILGNITYGLDTYQHIWSHSVERLLAPKSRFFRQCFNRPLARPHPPLLIVSLVNRKDCIRMVGPPGASIHATSLALSTGYYRELAGLRRHSRASSAINARYIDQFETSASALFS